MAPPPRRAKIRLGCFSALLLALGVLGAVYALLAPWSFHIGGRWTPAIWWGYGRLRDSAGAQYGVFIDFYPHFQSYYRRSGGLSPSLAPAWVRKPWPRQAIRGDGWVCTAAGATYRFDLSGQIFGAWLDSDGKEMTLAFLEPRGSKVRRTFLLYGTWHGGELAMDDRKSMFVHFLPDGTLTPARSYTSPVPERYAHVTLTAGSRGDFESLCAGLSRGRSPAQ